ncbi:hormone-sensitive lipase [Pseudohyphozyma bogoriensis]|nr:hormone-sensitive lipase [Pseudohyphozyma bogoriensis]
MLDQLYGRPSSSWKRTQVFLVLLFWISRLAKGNREGPRRVPLVRRLNKLLSRYTPWQIILSTFIGIYAVKHSDSILGLQAPEPLARLYSRNYYRATWIVTAFDAGFATAMNIRPAWLRHVASLAFTGYYLFFANEADEKLRKYRAICTVEMLRTTWEKTSNPILRVLTRHGRPRIKINKRILLPRPSSSSYTKPITAWLFFDGTEEELANTTDLVFDLPGGGFICMTPLHHEERLIRWAIKTKRPVLAFDYGKAPEYPYPFAIDEAYDAYKLLYESKGKSIGMRGNQLNVILTGDSAGANIATAVVVKMLESSPSLPNPVALVFAYPCLSFHFTSWMPSSDLKVLRQESSSNIAGLLRQKDHFEHRSPLSVVEDVERPKRKRTTSWGETIKRVASVSPSPARSAKFSMGMFGENGGGPVTGDEDYGDGDPVPSLGWNREREENKSLSQRVLFFAGNERKQRELEREIDEAGKLVQEEMSGKGPLETRLAMTNRIISPSMCRAMALLYIGPNNSPDLHSDYHISPIFTPPQLLAQFPPVYMSCGERDPFVDDTVIFAGKIREAKDSRKLELLAKQNKFGESLRMSSGVSSRKDPIVDEDEEDWVQMRIISGWSHGYLQMSSILPEANDAMDMMAEWIVEAFEKHHAKRQPTPPPAAMHTHSLPVPLPNPSLQLLKGASPKPSTPRIDAGSLSDKEEDEVLSFTPKKRSNTTSRANSPAPALGPTSSPPMARRFSGNRPTSLSLSESDDGSSTLPRTPSPAPSSSVSVVAGGQSPIPLVPSDIMSKPQQEEDLYKSTAALGLPSAPPLGTNGVASRSFTEPVPEKDRSTTSLSDDDHLNPLSAAVPHGGQTKTTRSGSAGAMETTGKFVDAKDLLKRRRADAVFGISTTNSAVQSDDEGEDGDKARKAHFEKRRGSGSAVDDES